jgi:hypothetical protein
MRFAGLALRVYVGLQDYDHFKPRPGLDRSFSELLGSANGTKVTLLWIT